MRRYLRRNSYRYSSKIRWDLFFVFTIIILILIISFFGIKAILFKRTSEYKLYKKGYSHDQIEFIINNYNESETFRIIELEKDDNIINFKKNKYFIFENLSFYLNFYKINNDIDSVVSIVNTNT